MMGKSKIFVFTLLMFSSVGLTFLPVSSAYAACPDGITSYWKLDEPTSGVPLGTYTDFVNDNDGIGAADPTAVAGIVNGAQEFDGALTGIDVPADRSFGWYSDESFSIEYWVKIDTGPPGTNEVVVGRDDSSTDLHWWTGISGTGKASFTLRDKNGNGVSLDGVGTINLADGFWHHVVAVRDESTGENLLYVDGDLQDSAVFDYTAGFDSISADLNIGYLAGAFRFGGMLDEVALYDRALTADEIEDHYDDGLAGQDYCLGSASSDAPFPEDTISLWKLDEANGPNYEDSFDDNDGTGADNPTETAGIVNGAQEFDGALTGINVPADRSFGWYSDESFSIEYWVKIDTGPPGTNEVVVGRDDGSTDLHWWTGISGTGKASFFLEDKNGNGVSLDGVGTINLADGFWHHVVAVRDESTGENLLYVDGDLQDSAVFDYTAGFDSISADLNIGYLAGAFRFGGMLDEVALYDRALTADEIQDHYDDGLAGQGIDFVAPVAGGGGGGGGGGCFISTAAK